MSKRAASPTRRRAASAKASGRGRVRRRKWMPLQALGWLLPAILALAVFIAGIILDTNALIGLFWGSLTGHYGILARVSALTVALACVTPPVLGGYRYLASPAPLPPPARKRTRRQPAPRHETRTEEPLRQGRPPRPAKLVDEGEAGLSPPASVAKPRKPRGVPQPKAPQASPRSRKPADRAAAGDETSPTHP